MLNVLFVYGKNNNSGSLLYTTYNKWYTKYAQSELWDTQYATLSTQRTYQATLLKGIKDFNLAM